MNGPTLRSILIYIDCKILEWAIDCRPIVEFVTQPVESLVKQRPNLAYRMTVHADQGFQYQDCRFINILKQAQIFQSMSRKATCLDNAVAEKYLSYSQGWHGS